MKVTLLGHATFLIQTKKTNIITDPILGDTFEGIHSKSFPSRSINTCELPKIDAIFLSHFHFDHFNLDSLKQLGANTPLYIPQDLKYIMLLKSKGFSNITIISGFKEEKVGDIRIIPTPSENHKHLEYGALFINGKNSFWTQVDTVVTEEISQQVKNIVGGKVNLVSCPHQLPLDYAHNWPEECFFPRSRYDRLVKMAARSNAETLITGSYGVNVRKEHDYLNYGFFPVKIADFLKDLKYYDNNIHAQNIYPGEGFDLFEGESHFFQNSSLVELKERDVDFEFNPDYFRKFITEEDADQEYDIEETREKTQELIKEIISNIEKNHTNKELFKNLLQKNYRVKIDVFYHQEKESWRVIKNGRVLFEKIPPDSNDWDYRFSYKASDLLVLRSGKSKQIPYTAYRNPTVEELEEPIELMGFTSDMMVDGSDPWHPLG